MLTSFHIPLVKPYYECVFFSSEFIGQKNCNKTEGKGIDVRLSANMAPSGRGAGEPRTLHYQRHY